MKKIKSNEWKYINYSLVIKEIINIFKYWSLKKENYSGVENYVVGIV
jgi:hypothetical protein